jgi:hypothetical protein
LAFQLEYGENETLAIASSAAGPDSHPPSWTTEQDAVVIFLRERAVKGPNWSTISKMLKKKLPKLTRSETSIKRRYDRHLVEGALGNKTYSSGQCRELRRLAEAFLRDNKMGLNEEDVSATEDILVPGQKFSIADDVESRSRALAYLDRKAKQKRMGHRPNYGRGENVISLLNDEEDDDQQSDDVGEDSSRIAQCV